MADILYTDTGGTTRALWGESVALVDDQSTNDNNASQANVALRGAVGRAAVGATPSATLDGGSGPAFLRMDLSDDAYHAAVPNNTYDVFVAGRGGSWIERDVVVSGGAGVTIGPSGIAGRNPGIMSALGGNPGNWADIVAIEVVDRTITASELAGLISYYRERGAKGLLVPGPERVVNGTYDTDLSGWTLNPSADGSLTWSSGAARIQSDGGYTYMNQNIGMDTAKLYQFHIDVTATTGAIKMGTSLSAADFQNLGTGSHTRLRQPDSAVLYIARQSGATDALVDNVSVRELIPEEDL